MHMTVTCHRYTSARQRTELESIMAGSELLRCVCLLLVAVASILPAVLGDSCPSDGCPDLSSHDIDLSPLRGVWEAVYYTQTEGSTVADVPHFFNISICGTISPGDQCSDSRVCYSDHMDTFYNLGVLNSCKYNYTNRTIQFTSDFSSEANFGEGNTTLTLICGRSLGVPEVVEGSPTSHAIQIVWVTSAACKHSTSLAAKTTETKCYHIHPYEDNGLKAKFIDLSELIKPEGYTVTYSEREQAKILLSICRPLEISKDSPHAACNGSMACLIETDPKLSSSLNTPLVLGDSGGVESNLHMHGDMLTTIYNSSGCSEDAGPGYRSVAIVYICPSENQDLGPHIAYADDKLCHVEVTWYTSFACGNQAIQSTGCTLTTQQGFQFDLTGLEAVLNVTGDPNQHDSSGQPYRYKMRICGNEGLNQLCDARDSDDLVTHVAQFDSSNTCWSLGGGEGKLRYADGSLTLTYTMGDSCHSNFKRTSVITFVCPKDVQGSSNNNSSALASTNPVTFIGETDCFYRFEWVTDLACGAETSGESSCEFELADRSYNFAPLVGTNDENWVAIDDDPQTACFMVHPCGELHVTDEKSSNYCNLKKAPKECTGSSVCQIFTNGSAVPIGKFNLQNTSTIESADAHILSIRGHQDNSHIALIHYVCKTGDLTTPPIFIGKTNGIYYEFHWTTYAACPSGIQPGQSCAVSHKGSGFTFDLSSMKPLTYESSDYAYEVGVCSVLRSNETKCTDGDKAGSSACQTVKSGGHYSLGKFNDTLIYEDGTLKLHYYNGTHCNHKDKPFRSSTLLFICDSTAHTPTINGITEDYCDYAIDIRTKEACPPAFRTTECIHFSGNKSFDFSELSRTLGSGNWETRGKDGSIYYINVCQPLNKAKGCGPLAAVCRAKTDTVAQHTEYTNLGMASTAKFSDVLDGNGKRTGINLEYKYKKPDGSSSGCPEVTTVINFVCNTSVINVETGPHFVFGGDKADPCHYTFTWETVAACPLQPKKSHSCQVTSPSGFTFDLSPLSTHNTTLTSKADSFNFDLAICGTLQQACNKSSDVGTVAVCQRDSKGQHHVCGKNGTQVLQYFDGSLSLKYGEGDVCHHVKAKRSVLINFECDRTLNDALGTPRYVREKDCQYTFEWPTALACEPQELDCVAAGGKYDLRPLLERKTWKVDKGEVKDDYEYVIGGCRSLDFRELTKCPQRPGMGACRYSNNREVSGEALGYMTGNIVEGEGGALRLMYSSGERCGGSGRTRMVHVEFQCGPSAGAGVPTLVSVDDTNCLVRIRWLTQYACSHDSNSNANKEWIIKDRTTGQEFDLTQLKSSVLTRLYHEGGTAYNYSVGLNGKSVSCPKATKTSGRVGACQTDTQTGKSHALGFISDNTTLDYIGGQLRVEYTGGDDCHHVVKSRKTVVTFECDKSKEGEFLQVLPEAECEYSFVVHTEIACPERGEIGVECILEGYEDLAGLVNMKVPPIEMNSTHNMYVSVCSPLSAANQQDYPSVKDCPASSGACIVDKNVVNLGKPSSQHPLKELKGKNGVEIEYIEGEMCVKNGTHEIRYTTKLLLICNRNVPIGVPEFVAKEEQNCEYIVRWETQFACHIDLPTSKTSKDVCNITDTTLSFSYNFKNLANEHPLSAVDKTTGTTYYIQLCGTASGPLPSDVKGCDHSKTGICQKKSNGETKTIMHAEHKLAMTSHTPHVIDVYYSSGEPCDSDPTRKWTAFLTLQCARGASETAQPVFQQEEDKCELHFMWQNSSFCVGVEACSVEDKKRNTVYNLDGLLAQTWTGLLTGPDEQTKTKEKGGSFSMSICRNLNPYSSSGGHCSSPSGICLHTPDGGHVNLGSLQSSLNISYYRGNEPVIHAMYRDGDVCPFNSGARKYQTDLFIHCGKELSTPLLSVHEDSRQGNCSWSVVINTPLACPPDQTTPANDTSCNKTTAAGTYVLPSFAKKSNKFTDDLGNSYTVTLCGSSGKIVQKTNDKSINLGNFQAMVVSATTNGPRLLYSSGDSCPKGRNQRFKSYIFMECNRSADPKDKKLTLQQDLSEDCQKFFFWSTPYACLSEEVSCSLTIDKGNIFYDFSPLHSSRKPWRVPHVNDVYYINICGAISDRGGFGITDCGPDTAVCMRNKDGVEEIATAGTQQITYTGDGDNVQLQFTGPVSKRCGNVHSHVTIHMQCGIQGLTFNSVSSCNYHFTWSSPYACKASDSHLTTYKTCPDTISGSSNFDFYPKKLSGSYHTTDERGVTYHVNLCDSADHCDDGVSVCVEESQTKKSIASFKNQTIMADGYQLMFHMSMEGEGKSHAIVRVVCLTQDDLDGHRPNTLEFENYAEVDSHQYYHFTVYTEDGCHFTAPSEAPSSDSNGGGGKSGGGGSNNKGGKSSKNGTVAAVLISMTVVIILIGLLAFVLYKKERRDYVRKALVYMTVGKSTEAVRYHRVSNFEMDEETALMEDRSGDESGEMSESEIDKKPKDGEESDEELLNL